MAEQPASVLCSILDSVLIDACSDPEIISSEPGRYFTRKRKFGAFSTIHYMLTHLKGTLNETILDYCWDNQIPVQNKPSRQAIAKSKKHLSDKALPFIFHEFNKRCAEYDYRTLKGHPVFGIDGTSLTTAYNPLSDTFMEKQGYNQFKLEYRL